MKLTSLNDLFLHQMKDLYNAEQQLLKAMPDMLEMVSSPELSSAIQTHMRETQMQIQRLEQCFQILGMNGNGEKCMAMEGILKEAKEFMQNDADPEVMDAGIIACAQRVEHYEIAGYGTACTYAKFLGHTEILGHLKEILSEEKMTDEKLTMIAETTVNRKAENH
ncbi:ferritin-like domain-containing protein [Rufibacter sediminis]|uniref:Ferritin-like domain-containing protein n=1 Tax=Rufibacter sediminis TaxID=2762756 RepID=A0ABR6VSM5_9BACT|nr:ferritin-like domain-containing protein [Rufibacter sediminis]MBC3540200.1 ferritin-like domain-containing protein [Rufibacter sediminis]